jgi:hypothetical protein
MKTYLEASGLWQNHPMLDEYLESFKSYHRSYDYDQIIKYFDSFNLGIDHEELKQGIKTIKANENLSFALEFLVYALVIKGHPSMHLIKHAKIKSDLIDPDLFELIVVLSLIDPSVKTYQKQGIDQKHIDFNLGHIKGFIKNFYNKEKKLGIENFGWTTYLASLGLIHLESLNFMHHFYHDPFYGFRHKQTNVLVLLPHANKEINKLGQFSGTNQINDVAFITKYQEYENHYEGNLVDPRGYILDKIIKLDKSMWDLVIKEQTPVIDFHIPTKTPYSIEDIKKSFKAAQLFFNKYFKYDYKAFYCVSWLYSPQLENVISKEKSRILDIYKQGYVAPSTVGIHAVYSFIFHEDKPDLSNIKPKTSLERDIMTYVNQGHTMNCGMYLYLTEDVDQYGNQRYRNDYRNLFMNEGVSI